MPRIRWTRRASLDLSDILIYIADDNPPAARKMAGTLREAAKVLGRHPNLGRLGRVTGTREMVVIGTPYLIVYRVTDAVEILAVIHGAREWPAEF